MEFNQKATLANYLKYNLYFHFEVDQFKKKTLKKGLIYGSIFLAITLYHYSNQGDFFLTGALAFTFFFIYTPLLIQLTKSRLYKQLRLIYEGMNGIEEQYVIKEQELVQSNQYSSFSLHANGIKEVIELDTLYILNLKTAGAILIDKSQLLDQENAFKVYFNNWCTQHQIPIQENLKWKMNSWL